MNMSVIIGVCKRLVILYQQENSIWEMWYSKITQAPWGKTVLDSGVEYVSWESARDRENKDWIAS